MIEDEDLEKILLFKSTLVSCVGSTNNTVKDYSDHKIYKLYRKSIHINYTAKHVIRKL